MDKFSYIYSDKTYEINILFVKSNVNIVDFIKKNDKILIQINDNKIEITNNTFKNRLNPYTLYYLMKSNIEQNLMKIVEKENKYYITLIQKGYFDQEEDIEHILEI